jgi:hypothetical protein
VAAPVTKFLLGFLTGMLLLLLSAAAAVQFGLMDVSANAQIRSWIEQWYPASVRRSVGGRLRRLRRWRLRQMRK